MAHYQIPMVQMIRIIRDNHILAASVLLVLVWLGIMIFHPPRISSDSLTYIEAIDVLNGSPAPQNFVPNRILTTYGYLQMLSLLEVFSPGDVKPGWVVLNTIFFFAANIFFYLTILELYRRKKVAIFGMLIIATNYAMVANSLDYVMDIGGWASLSAVLYFVLRYLRTDVNKYLYCGSMAVAAGLFLKEYAILGLIAIFLAVVCKNYKVPKKGISLLIQILTLALVPVFILYAWTYVVYHYSYYNWYSYAGSQATSRHVSNIVEYIKVLGSLYTFGWLLSIISFFMLVRERAEGMGRENLAFIIVTAVSAMPVLFWPFAVQRILFPLIPPLVFLGIWIFVKREKAMIWSLPALVLYIVTNYAMDAYVFGLVNIDYFISFLK